jgi:glycosyltransferase involved in cell wall biosynthesis
VAPSFTVVIATYNRPELLRNAIASVQAQSVKDFECIIVDDASDTAGRVMPADGRFRLIALSENRGLAGAWNVGVDAATGDAVSFLDDDDLWTPERLELGRTGLARADVAVCGGGLVSDQKATSSGRMLEGDVHDHIVDSFTPNMGRTAVRREVMLRFDERYRGSQDVEWWIRQTARSRVATEPGVGHLYRAHDGARSGNGARARVAAGELMLVEHADYFAAHPRARAFRQMRIGQMLLRIGDKRAARRWLVRSLRSSPTPGAARDLARSVLPRPRRS